MIQETKLNKQENQKMIQKLKNYEVEHQEESTPFVIKENGN